MPFLKSAACLAILSLAAAPAAITAQETPPARLPSVTLPPELDRVLRDYERNWAAGDEAALAALFDPASRQGSDVPAASADAPAAATPAIGASVST
mgnify:CR=1 FL=1